MAHIEAILIYVWCFAGLITALNVREYVKSKIKVWEWIILWVGWPGAAAMLIYYGLNKKI
jgi:hypothetical protein